MKAIVRALVITSLLSMSVIVYLTTNTQTGGFNLTKQNFLTQDSQKKAKYMFNNPAFAYKVLSHLEYSTRTGSFSKMNGEGFELKDHHEYCDHRREYIIKHPESVFEDINIVSNVAIDSLIRKEVFPLIGKDIHPEFGPNMPKAQAKNARTYLKNEANLFLTSDGVWGPITIGQHYSCLSQVSNHLPGHGLLIFKDLVAISADIYGKEFQDKPQCFNPNKTFPRTWVLYKEKDCKEFFEALNSTEYQEAKKDRGIVYITKVARYAHKADGVQPVKEQEEKRLRDLYDNGNKCGQIEKYYMIQNYIHNPLLVNGRKCDFRTYMLIASSNPLIVYYHDGFLRVTLDEYDIESNDKQVLLTNAALTSEIFKKVKAGGLHQGLDEQGLLHAQKWTYDEFFENLYQAGVVTDPNWLDNYLRPELKKAMVHLIRMTSSTFQRDSSLYELHGVDFMLDSDLNLWFIESNSSPGFGNFPSPMKEFIMKMVQDQIKIVIGLLRSRMKRVVNYVNELIETGEASEMPNGAWSIHNFLPKKAKFIQITQNYFEKEFEPSVDNGFVLILNENHEGVERYQGLVSQECL